MNKQQHPKRSFIPGEEWVYYKLYSGSQMADIILTDIIEPCKDRFISSGIVDKWFFVRYHDPHPHLRIRFHLKDVGSMSIIVSELMQVLLPLNENNMIWKVQLDTYKREVERYGHANMEFVEGLFYFDSEMLVNMMTLLDGDEGEITRWQFALKSVDALLEDFRLTAEAKLAFITNLKDAYAKEFGIVRSLKAQIDNKYRKEFEGISAAINGTSDLVNTDMLRLLEQRSNSNSLLINKMLFFNKEGDVEPHFSGMLSSIIHMSMNRIFNNNQRKHEMVIYDFLFRYYKSAMARKRYSI